MPNLKPYHTFGMDVSAQEIIPFEHIEQLQSLIEHVKEKSKKMMILGGGSNVLFLKDFDGVVLLNRIKGISKVKEDSQFVWVCSGAGEIWDDLVHFALDQQLGGIENLTSIPGCVGAAPMQNIGAYGVELKDVFDHLTALEMATGEIKTFNLEDCQFGYRESVFKNAAKDQYVILSVTIKLKKVHTLNMNYGDIKATLNEMNVQDPGIRDVSEAVAHIRRSKLPDPKVLGNAGSFFKNPEISHEQAQQLAEQYPLIPRFPGSKSHLTKISAAWLIEQCGFKGKRVGNCGSHEKQALVLVNYGGARGEEVYNLCKEIIQQVYELFGIQLSPEVNLIS